MVRRSAWHPILLAAVLAAAPAAAEDAKTLYDRGYLRQAAVLCEQRLAANPKDAEAGAFLARIRAEQGEKDQALKLANAAVAADPKSAEAEYALAEYYGREARSASLLHQAGLAGKMKKASEAALAIDPNHIDALEISSDFYRYAPGIMGGDKKKSVEYVDRMVKADPVAGWLKRAEIAMEGKDKDTVRAAECYRQAAAVEPTSQRAQVALAAPAWHASRMDPVQVLRRD